jgi:hypothetical protein
MAEMSMNRVIHSAFRRDLNRFDSALATLAAGDGRRAGQLGVAWDNFYKQLTVHHHSEHRIAWPALRKAGVSDELITQLDAEHDKMATALDAANDAMRAVRRTPTADNITAARDTIAKLRTVAVEHLDHEEAELEPFLLENENNPIIKAMGRDMGREFKPPEAGVFFAWVQDGATSDETDALRRTVPGPVIMIIGRVFGGKYRRTVAPVWR